MKTTGAMRQVQARGAAADGDTSAFVVSMLVHTALFLALALVGWRFESPRAPLVMQPVVDETLPVEPPPPPPVEPITQFTVSDTPTEKVGAENTGGAPADDVAGVAGLDALLASEIVDQPDIPSPEQDNLAADAAVLTPTESQSSDTLGKRESAPVGKGATGVGTTGSVGAIDRITLEILKSLEDRKTLVVWAFDATVSLTQQRKALHDRMDRIYRELGLIEASGNPAFAQHHDKPLLTSVIAFGQSVQPQLRQPTDNLSEIKLAIAGIQVDRSGMEKTFEAIVQAAELHKKYVVQHNRRVMIVVFTDEAGEDQTRCDEALRLCRKYQMPVYVVGVPAPFGARTALMKWVDPDPKFDQSPQFGRVDQGPESRFPEVVKLLYPGQMQPDDPMDSGYGPYSLARVTYETGGIYFTVHPNRESRNVVSRQETAVLSAHLTRFFDSQVMSRYRPDYLTEAEYQKQLAANRAKAALVQAAAAPEWVGQMGGKYLRFPKVDDGDLTRRLSEAQKEAAKLEPQINTLVTTLRTGETDRAKLDTPRWQAGYDLALGRALAAKVRTEAYNAMLAQAKSMKFKDPKNDTWVLEASDKVTVGSALEKDAAKARECLQRVVQDHGGTPWAYLAERELKSPLGWEWKEMHTGVNKPKPPPPANTPPPPPKDDKAQMIKKPPPRRDPPPL